MWAKPQSLYSVLADVAAGIKKEENMSVKIGKRGYIPNWIKYNDWSYESRIKFANEIMAFSPRDWSKYDYADGGVCDTEKWALWCLIICDTKEDALNQWYDFCDENS